MQRFTVPALIAVIVVVAAAAIFLNLRDEPMITYPPAAEYQPASSTMASTPATNPAGWKMYEDQSLSFQYPAVLVVGQNGPEVSVTHAIDYPHPNPCDFRGDGGDALKISDFNITIRLYSNKLSEVVRMHESDYLEQNYIKSDSALKLETGFIDSASYGSLQGYKVSSGVEGCGVYTYYFQAPGNKTLFVRRPFTPTLDTTLNTNAATYLALPGIIAPEKAESYFNSILTSLRVR